MQLEGAIPILPSPAMLPAPLQLVVEPETNKENAVDDDVSSDDEDDVHDVSPPAWVSVGTSA